MATIGPVTVDFIEAIRITSSRQNSRVSIPYGRQIAYLQGVNLTSYQINSYFYGDNQAKAKAARAALHGLVNQVDSEMVFITFDHDQAELNGWFLIEGLDTQIQGLRPDDYQFSFSAIRVAGGDTNFIPGIFFDDDNPKTSGCCAGVTWLTVPNEYVNPGIVERGTYDGAVQVARVLTNPTDDALQVLAGVNPATMTFNSRCVVYDTVIPHFDISEVNPDKDKELDWEPIYNTAAATGDIVISNGLIRFNWMSQRNSVDIQYLKGRSVADWWFSKQWLHFRSTASGNYTGQVAPTRPYIVSLSDEKVVWIQYFRDASNLAAGDVYPITFTLRRGAPFIEGKVKPSGAAIDGEGSGLEPHSGVTSKQGDCWIGMVKSEPTINSLYAFFALTNPTVGDTSTRLRFPDDVADGTEFEFAIYASHTSLTPSSSSLLISGQLDQYICQWISNTDQQTVFVDPAEAVG